MRKDIEIHINTGDVTISAQNKYKLRDFRWVDNSAGLDSYIYGEVDIPAAISENIVRNGNASTAAGFYFTIPYTPAYQPFMLRIRRVYGDGSFQYILNETNGSVWHMVKAGFYGATKTTVRASQLMLISDGDFYGRINGGNVELYAAGQSDFNIVEANRQNANLLLACHPGNNYRYPLTGIGMSRWINSNITSSSEMASVIQSEFEADGVYVNSASFDFDTHELALDVNVANTD